MSAIMWPDYCQLAGLKVNDLPMWKIVEEELERIAASFSVATKDRLRFVSEKRKFKGLPTILIMLHRVIPQDNTTKHIMDLFFIEPTPDFAQLRVIPASALSELTDKLDYYDRIEKAADVNYSFEALAGDYQFTSYVLRFLSQEEE